MLLVFGGIAKLFSGNKKKISSEFRSVREELDVHLDTINENTSELLENRGMIMELQERFCKLVDLVQELHVRLDGVSQGSAYPERVELGLREQELFLLFYTSSRTLTVQDISRALSIPVIMVHEIISSMVTKGVSVLSDWVDGEMVFRIDPLFAEHQSRHGVVRVDGIVSQQINKYNQLSLLD